MASVDVNGVGLFYDEVGDGVPCIALHGGLGLDHTYLKRTLGPLADVLRLVYVDQRGNGRSERPDRETITIEQLADDVDGLRAALGHDRFALLGHSFGGFVALEYATRYPNRLSHLILLNTSPGAFEPTPAEVAERPDPQTISPAAIAATQASTVPTSNEEFAASMRHAAPAYVRSIDPDVLVELLDDTIFDIDTGMRGFESLAQWSVADKLDAITCPTLVVCGRYDLQTTPECSKRLTTAIPNAELLWLEKSAHFPWLEEPDAFFAGVKDFLARNA